MSTIFETLREDHDKHRRLLDLVAKTKGDSDGRRELFDKLKTELESHANAEERAFYSVLLADEMTQPKSSHSIKEHQEMDELLTELDSMDFSNPHWLPKFRELKEQAEHHMAEEEREVFQIAGKVLSKQQKDSLSDTFKREKRKELQDS